ncbi:MAG: GNAT family N-acetyltransferase [Ruminococcus sp.]|nr:GNAT family N-acetyltransferase [Ruminococcus sp.]MBO5384323.1 GNAT family N-acetyltransferase [Ruminococcus sp.]MBR6671105.1 GNAT family N-acetyltransferase [Ruminococcus sp.]
MSIRLAELSDLKIIANITETTISEIYPHYYPKGAVVFFLNHHREENIIRDIEHGQVYICMNSKQEITGTVTVKDNEILRLFVLPQYQGRGYGREMLDFAEKSVLEKYDEVVIDASLPAKRIYRNRGYKETESNIIEVSYNDYLCYDVMVKQK